MPEIRTAVPEEVDAYLEALVRKGIFSNKAELVRAAANGASHCEWDHRLP